MVKISNYHMQKRKTMFLYNFVRYCKYLFLCILKKFFEQNKAHRKWRWLVGTFTFQVNPKNHYYDKFYIINYLELGKRWLEVVANFSLLHYSILDWSHIENGSVSFWKMWVKNQVLKFSCFFSVNIFLVWIYYIHKKFFPLTFCILCI